MKWLHFYSITTNHNELHKSLVQSKSDLFKTIGYLSPNEFEVVTSSEVWSVKFFLNMLFVTESWVYQTKLFYNHE